MRYMGSKRRLWKYIAPIILENRKKGQLYVEPFCGGCNSLSQVGGRRLAADNNPYLIEMLKSVINEQPQIYPISKEIYDEVRKDYRNENFSRYTIAETEYSLKMVDKEIILMNLLKTYCLRLIILKELNFNVAHMINFKFLMEVLYILTHRIEIRNNTQRQRILIMSISIGGLKNFLNVTTEFS